MRAFYSEWEPYAAQWLRNLMAEGLIPEGHVDERDVRELDAEDLVGFSRVSLFAGIAGWEHALDLAGWPDDGRSLWTVSCPCQPFSTAGRGEAEEDPRHLWPVVAALVRERQPDFILGEQTSSASGYRWLDGVRADLEEAGYAFGAADLPSCCTGAPHVRNRLWWFARRLANGNGSGRRAKQRAKPARRQQPDATRSGETGGLADSLHGTGSAEQGQQLRQRADEPSGGRTTGRLADADGDGRYGQDVHLRERQPRRAVPGAAGPGVAGGMGDAGSERRDGREGGEGGGRHEAERREESGYARHAGFWGDCRVIPCRDGKLRRISAQRGDEPLADGLPAHLVATGPEGETAPSKRKMLACYGNAVNPHCAAVFVRAVLEVLREGGLI